MENELNTVDCAKFIDFKVMVTWDIIDGANYLQDKVL